MLEPTGQHFGGPNTFNLYSLRSMIGGYLPRTRRWRRFLNGLTLDPDALEKPVQAPSEQDFIMCGSPRTGTTLLSAVLFQPPQIMTVMEPWDGMRLPPSELFASLRSELCETGQTVRGKLDVGALLAEGKVTWRKEGGTGTKVPLGEEFLLGVKWPAFWRYLELLPRTKFLICVRNPFDTISSYANQGGRLSQGYEYDTLFNRSLNNSLRCATSQAMVRRILLYEMINRVLAKYEHRENVFVVHFERWFTDARDLRAEMSEFLGTELGAGPATIRHLRHGSRLSSTERDLIRQYCHSVASFGYALQE